MMQVEIRSFTGRDIGFALTQTVREGWDSTAELFRVCLAHDPHGCFVAEIDASCVGMITTTCYRCSAWIGNLIVVPDLRGQGIGRRLMTHAMRHLSDRGVRTVRLEADPPGVQLYHSLGFVDEFESLRFKLDPDETTAAEPCTRQEPAGVQRAGHADLPALAAFDAAYFGDDRSRLLALLYEEAKATYWLKSPQGVRGYAMVLSSAAGCRIGPCVARDIEVATDLLTGAFADLPDRAIVIGIASVNAGGVALLESRGLMRTPSSLRMIYGSPASAGKPEMVYAIANGAMG